MNNAVTRFGLTVLYRLFRFNRDFSDLFVELFGDVLYRLHRDNGIKSKGMSPYQEDLAYSYNEAKNKSRDYEIHVGTGYISYQWGERDEKERFHLRWHTKQKQWEFWQFDDKRSYAHHPPTLQRRWVTVDQMHRLKTWRDCFYWDTEVVKQYIGGRRAAELIKKMREYKYSDDEEGE